jgi:hypothetical protein
MNTKIHRAAWKVMWRILLITKMYVETLFIFWLMLAVLPPMPLYLAVAVVCLLVYAIERVWQFAGLKIKSNYDIIDDPKYDERTVRKVERAAI